MEEFTRQIIAYISAHPHLAVFVIGAVAFGESFAFINLFFPGSAVLVAAGALIRSGALDPASAAAAAAGGAVLGDVISYAIGHKYGNALPDRWPFRRHPAAVERGVNFFRRYGWASVFVGRFFGPLRAFVTLIAGMFRMRFVPFLAASVLSAVLWAPGLLFSGYLMGLIAAGGWSTEAKIAFFAAAAILLVLAAYAARRAFRA